MSVLTYLGGTEDLGWRVLLCLADHARVARGSAVRLRDVCESNTRWTTFADIEGNEFRPRYRHFTIAAFDADHAHRRLT